MCKTFVFYNDLPAVVKRVTGAQGERHGVRPDDPGPQGRHPEHLCRNAAPVAADPAGLRARAGGGGRGAQPRPAADAYAGADTANTRAHPGSDVTESATALTATMQVSRYRNKVNFWLAAQVSSCCDMTADMTEDEDYKLALENAQLDMDSGLRTRNDVQKLLFCFDNA